MTPSSFEDPSPERGTPHEYGYDSQQRIIVHRRHLGPGPSADESFHLPVPGGEAVIAVRWPGNIDHVARWWMEDGRPASMVRVGRVSHLLESYGYEDGRLVRITTMHGQQPRRTLAVQTDDTGALQRIDRLARGARRVPVYVRPPPGVTLRGLLDRLETVLLDEVPRALQAVRLRGPVCSLALVYGNERRPSVPPQLMICTAAVRTHMLRHPPPWGGEGLLDPYRYPRHGGTAIDLAEGRLAGDYALARQQVRIERAGAAAIAMMRRVAFRLCLHDWSGIMETTADFFAWSTGFGEASARDDLAASVPSTLLARLRVGNGW